MEILTLGKIKKVDDKIDEVVIDVDHKITQLELGSSEFTTNQVADLAASVAADIAVIDINTVVGNHTVSGNQATTGTITASAATIGNNTFNANISTTGEVYSVNVIASNNVTVGGDLVIYGSGRPDIVIRTQTDTGKIADTFSGNTDKAYIDFNDNSGSNDPGYIMHESRNTVETNEGVLHLCPSDDNGYGDYVSIHGTNDPDKVKIHTDGTIEGVKDLYANKFHGDGSSLTNLPITSPKVVMAGYANYHNRTSHSWQGITFAWYETSPNSTYVQVSGNNVKFLIPGAYAINYFAMSHDNNRYYAHHRIHGAVYHHTHTYGYQWVDHNFNLAHKFTQNESVNFDVYKQGTSNSYTWHSGGTYSMITITYLGAG
jgi:hypothetical protein